MAKIIVPGEEAIAQNTSPQAATYEQLVSACEGASADFIVKQLSAKATVQQAQAAFVADLKAQADTAKKEAKAAQDEAKKQKELALARRRKPGVRALGEPGREENDKNKDEKAEEDDEDKKMEDEDEEKKAEDDKDIEEDEEPEDAKQRFAAKVHYYMRTRKVARSGTADQPGAIQLVAINHPKLHRNYLKATNPGRKMARILDEKFDTV